MKHLKLFNESVNPKDVIVERITVWNEEQGVGDPHEILLINDEIELGGDVYHDRIEESIDGFLGGFSKAFEILTGESFNTDEIKNYKLAGEEYFNDMWSIPKKDWRKDIIE